MQIHTIENKAGAQKNPAMRLIEVYGKVVNEEKLAVANASVRIAGVMQEVYTDSLGHFSMKAETTMDTLMLEVFSIGYAPFQQAFNESDNAINITLQAVSCCPSFHGRVVQSAALFSLTYNLV